MVDDELVGGRQVDPDHQGCVNNPAADGMGHELEKLVFRAEGSGGPENEERATDHHEGDVLNHVAPEEVGGMDSDGGGDDQRDAEEPGEEESALAAGGPTWIF